MSTSPWRTGHRGEGCGACAGAFVPGTTVVSALFEASEFDIPVPAASESDGGGEETAAGPAESGAAETGSATPVIGESGPAEMGSADEAAPFRRADFCATCFDGDADTGSPFSWWRALVPPPEEKKATFDLSVAREFLVRLLGEDDAARAPLRYLLTLLLMRKRIVKVSEHYTDERGEVMAIRFPPGDAIHEVVCVELGEEETETLREQLGELFDLG